MQANTAGQVALKLKTPWRDGTTHLVMLPLALMQRLAGLEYMQRLAALAYVQRLAALEYLQLLAALVPKTRRSNNSAALVSAKWWCEPTCVGRSTLSATVSVVLLRPGLSACSPSSMRYSPEILRPVCEIEQSVGARSPTWCCCERSLRPESR